MLLFASVAVARLRRDGRETIPPNIVRCSQNDENGNAAITKCKPSNWISMVDRNEFTKGSLCNLMNGHKWQRPSFRHRHAIAMEHTSRAVAQIDEN